MNTINDALNPLTTSGNLPSLPQVLVRLLDCCQAPDVDIQEIAQIVSKDAALSAKVLQLVNSAFIGARNPIANIEQAVVYLGMDSIRNLAISVSVQQVFRRVQINGLLSMDRFWHHSFTNALIAQKIAQLHTKADPSEAYLSRSFTRYRQVAAVDGISRNLCPSPFKGYSLHQCPTCLS